MTTDWEASENSKLCRGITIRPFNNYSCM